MTARTIHGPDDFASAFHVSPETIERLAAYERLLRQWQKAVNLVAPRTLEAIWHRHFADSAQLLALAPPETRSWIDLGSGGGFPGLVIAILLADATRPPGVPPPGGGRAMRPRLSTAVADLAASSVSRAKSLDASGGGEHPSSRETPPPGAPNELAPPGGSGTFGRNNEAALTRGAPSSPLEGEGHPSARTRPRVTLIESDTRKAAFLREVARHTAIPAGVTVDILSIRAESARLKVNAPLPRVVCARALAPLEQLLELAAPLSPPGTTGLYCKGKGVAGELQEARKTWKFDVALVPSLTDRDGRIAVITNLDRKAKD
jgi:16S rRNA (guanine527-N7)-methyltransferase